MKRHGGLWPQVIAFPNLLQAWHKARRGKRTRPATGRFALDLEAELLTLQASLADGTWQPGTYRRFTVYERKPRLISAAPFRDRVVHHALMNIIEPALDRRFIFDSYACRTGKGVHAAVDRYQTWARRYPYVLKMDIGRYFPSIDRARLMQKLAACLKDPPLLEVLSRIVHRAPEESGTLAYFPGDDLLAPLAHVCGIPIGNLTSQCFANLYLDDFDHWMKEVRREPAYLRYVDDMVVLGDDKSRLADVREAVRARLAEDRLLLHPCKAHISPTAAGLNLLGYVVYPRARRLRGDNWRRFARHLRRQSALYAAGRLDWDDIDPGVQSWIGHARHADTLGLRERLFAMVSFRRGVDRASASG